MNNTMVNVNTNAMTEEEENIKEFVAFMEMPCEKLMLILKSKMSKEEALFGIQQIVNEINSLSLEELRAEADFDDAKLVVEETNKKLNQLYQMVKEEM